MGPTSASGEEQVERLRRGTARPKAWWWESQKHAVCGCVPGATMNRSGVLGASLLSRDDLRLKRQLEHADVKHHPQDCGLQPEVHRKLHTGFGQENDTLSFAF